MIDNLIFSINTVLPLCIFVALGWILRRKLFFDDKFFTQVDKFIFKLALPAMVFLDVIECDISELTDSGLIGFAVVGVTGTVLILLIVVPLIIKDNARRGAVIQGIYRSNFAVLGISLAGGIAGDAGLHAIALVMPFTIVMFNAYAVIVLSIFSGDKEKSSVRAIAREVIKNVVTNPLIIATVLALLLMLVRYYLHIELPKFALTAVEKLQDTVYALSLMSLGASMTPEGFGEGRLRTAVTASVFKTVILPAIAVTAAALLGFEGARICVIFVMFGAPTAISSYIMAKNMKSDSELAGQILLISTVMSLGTIFLGVFIMKTLGLI